MSALMVAFVRVHDLEAYNREYLSIAHPLIGKYGGKALAVSEKVKQILVTRQRGLSEQK